MSEGNNKVTIGQVLEMLAQKVDLDLKNIDYSAGGGDIVTEWQVPTAENNYTWYRKYASGWIEQGGKFVVTSASVGANTYSTATLTFPVPFSALMSWNVQAKHDRFNAGFVFDTFGSANTVTVYQVNDSNSNAFINPFVIWIARGFC